MSKAKTKEVKSAPTFRLRIINTANKDKHSFVIDANKINLLASALKQIASTAVPGAKSIKFKLNDLFEIYVERSTQE